MSLPEDRHTFLAAFTVMSDVINIALAKFYVHPVPGIIYPYLDLCSIIACWVKHVFPIHEREITTRMRDTRFFADRIGIPVGKIGFIGRHFSKSGCNSSSS